MPAIAISVICIALMIGGYFLMATASGLATVMMYAGGITLILLLIVVVLGIIGAAFD